MTLGQKALDGLNGFLIQLETGKPIKATEVRRVDTPDGPMHIRRETTLGGDKMQKELEDKFLEKWPTWFAGLHDGDPRETCLAFGFECSDGWNDLLWRLCEDIEKLGPGEDFRVEQVKEKFGGLRFYTSGTNTEVFNRITEAENESYKTCEFCGSKEDVTSTGSWVTTRCKSCREKKNA